METRRVSVAAASLCVVLITLGAAAQLKLADADTTEPDAKTLYSRYCSLCHGDQCQGAMGTPLQNMTCDDKTAVSITEDGDGKQMPAFGQELTVNQIKGLIAYIHTFDSKKK